MIKYNIICDDGHEFEVWFSNSAAFDVQRCQGRIECPVCGSQQVEKALMAPAIYAGSKDKTDADVVSDPITSQETAPGQVKEAFPGELSKQEKSSRFPHLDKSQVKELMQNIKKILELHSEYVGDSFAREVRDIEAGEAEDRMIHGEATQEEVKELLEDGIAVVPIPKLPENVH